MRATGMWILLLSVLLCAAAPASAQPPADPVHERMKLRKLKLAPERVQEAKTTAGRALERINGSGLTQPLSDDQLSLGTLQDRYQHVLANTQVIGEAYSVLLDGDPRLSDLDLLKTQLAQANALLTASATALATMSAQYGVYVGPSFSLGADGKWKSGAEVLARFDPEAAGREESPLCFWPFRWCRPYSEFSYQVIAAVDAQDAANPSTPVASRFAQSGGYFRFNGGLRPHFTDWLGLRFGVGMSSLPDETLGGTRLEPRVFGGLDFQTIYGDGSLGQLFIGYAHDHFWQRNVAGQPGPVKDYNRWIVDGLFMLPGRQSMGFQLAARLYADAPVRGDGPSEVRASILLYRDFSDWQSLFDPVSALTGK